jgi:hypothetical protein
VTSPATGAALDAAGGVTIGLVNPRGIASSSPPRRSCCPQLPARPGRHSHDPASEFGSACSQRAMIRGPVSVRDQQPCRAGSRRPRTAFTDADRRVAAAL